MKRTALLAFLTFIRVILAGDPEFTKPIPKNSGGRCSGSSGSGCGFGAVCNRGFCTEDYSQPASILRKAQDMGPCDSAEVLSAVHLFDDKVQAFTKHSSSSWGWSKFQFEDKKLSSTTWVRDCTTLYENICNGTTYLESINHIYRNGALSEKDKKFSSNPDYCDNKGSKNYIKIHQRDFNEKFSNKCFSGANELIREIRKNGPVAHDFRVFGELLDLDGKRFNVIDYKEIDFEKYRREEGYTSVVVAGWGTDRQQGEYIMLKFPFGDRYAHEGYLKIEQGLLFDRYMPKCGTLERYLWRENEVEGTKLPLLGFYADGRKFRCHTNDLNGFGGVQGELEEKYKEVCDAIIERIRGRPTNFHDLSATRPIVDDKFNLNDPPTEDEIPYLRQSILHVLHRLNHMKKDDYCYYLEDIIAADLTIVSGRKVFTILQLRRKERRKGCKINEKINFHDEAVNERNNIQPNPVFVQAEIWFPLKTSDTKGYESQQYGLLWSSPHAIILNPRFLDSRTGTTGGSFLARVIMRVSALLYQIITLDNPLLNWIVFFGSLAFANYAYLHWEQLNLAFLQGEIVKLVVGVIDWFSKLTWEGFLKYFK